jgi:hypothetical protein
MDERGDLFVSEEYLPNNYNDLGHNSVDMGSKQA